MGGYAGVLIDIGGVVHSGDAVIDGAAEAIRRLAESGKPFRFLTNTTSQPLSAVHQKLLGFGLDVSADTIFTPARAARNWLIEHRFSAHLLTAPGLAEDYVDMPRHDDVAVVVGDAGDGFTYARLTEAFQLLHAGAPLIGLAGNRYYAGPDGTPVMDAGPFIAALEYAADTKAVILGKPAAEFFLSAAADMGAPQGETVMIGDDAEFDVSAAIACGLDGILVHTGKWQKGDGAGVVNQPTTECADLGAAVDLILQA